ncbi:MAG: ABC transporter substrate-binding protein [Spirochaetaceae bacterium]|nr:ABC transporter substrate-binding protein [Spirochaetaceae bacterium]
MKQFFKICSVMLLAVILVVSFAACKKQAKEEKVTEVSIGFMSSMTGTFAGVAETQRKAFLYGVEKVNAAGGLNMPWGKVKLNPVVADDEAKLDIGVQRLRDMINKGVFAVTGGVWNPISAVFNEEGKINPILYVPGYVPALDSYKKGVPAEGTFSSVFTPWTLGYLNGQSIVQDLGKKKIFFVERNDSWGATIKAGLEAALKDYGGTIVGTDRVNLGTADYSAVINKALKSDAEVFLFSMFAGDAIACAKQVSDMGLNKKMLTYNCFITNVVAGGIPPAALDNLYGLAYFYWDSTNPKVKEFSDGFSKMWNEPPDAYGATQYVAFEIAVRGAEKAGSFDPSAIAKVLMSGSVDTIKGAVSFRADQLPVIEEAAFLVRGKAESARSGGPYDFFQVIKSYGGAGILPSLEFMGF